MNTRRAYAVAAGLLISAAWVRGANLASDVSAFSADVRNYNLVCLGNAALTSSNDTQEGLAVEGNLTLDGNTLMSGGGANFVASGDPGLYVGGHLTLNGGYSKMNGSYASTPGVGTGFTFSSKRLTAPSSYGSGILDSTNSSAANASTSPITNPVPSGWSWSTLTSSFTSISSDLASAPATGTISVSSQNLTFTPPSPLPSSGVVVFSLDCNLLGMGSYNGKSFSNVSINVPTGVDYVINVTNASGQTLFPCGTNFNSGTNNGQIIWNIVGSGTLSFDGGQFFGAVLAPSMTLSTSSTILNGQVVAAGFTNSGAELHFTTFTPATAQVSPPVINPPLSVTGAMNTAFTYTISATNSPTSFNATGLPSWLSLNTTTGVLSGTPTAAGTFTCTISATNAGGTGSATLTITVSQTYTLTIAGSPAAGGTFTGAGVYAPGTVVSISETANSGYRTNGWGGANGSSTASPTSASTTITLNSNASLTAQFVQQAAISVVAQTGGTVTGSGTYDVGTSAAITETPNSGYRFTGWSNSGTTNYVASTSAPSTTVTVPAGGLTVTGGFTPLTPPVFTSPNNLQVLVVGQPYSFTATATNSPTFAGKYFPPGVTMATTGVISGTPTTVGSYTATLTAANSSGSATQSLPFIVYPVPVINPPLSVTGQLNVPFSYTITATGSPTSFGATGLPSWLTVNTATGVISGTPTATGTFTCTIFAANPAVSGSAVLTITVSQTYTLSIAGSPAAGGTFTGAGVYSPGTVVPITQAAASGYRTNGWGGTDGGATAAPGSASTTITMSANRSLTAQFVAQEALTVNAGTGGTATGSGTFDQGTAAPITATPSTGYRFTGWSGSGIANTSAAATTVTLTAPTTVTANFAPLTPPVFTSPNNLQILVLGQPYSFTATATNAPTFSGVGFPPGITMASSGVISGTPTALGPYTATLTATNSSGTATQSLPFIVYPIPVINPPLFVSGLVNVPFSYTISATGSPTSFGATGLPSWLTLNPVTGALTGTPTTAGTFTCTISASNPGATGTATLTITVTQTYTLTVTGSPAAGGTFTTGGVYTAGTQVPITETANPGYRASGWGGPDGPSTASPTSASTTILMWSNRTLVAQFVQQGTLTVVAGTGGTATGGGSFDVGSSTTISATPSAGYQFAGWTGTGVTNPSSASTTVTISGNQTVTANFALLTPPVFTSPNNLQVLVVGQPYSFTATATYSPTFSAVSLPLGISMAPSGVISGTPTTVGSWTATLTATNSSGSATQNLPFIVYPVPVINPPLTVSARLNVPMTYTITATGSPTSFGATGLPSWLTLDPATGIITGTPTATGSFTCTISASNPGATGSATLTINVTQTYTLTITGSPAAGGSAFGAGIYDPGSVVSISETANPGYRTAGWGGASSGNVAAASNPQTTIVMNSDQSLVAEFVQQATLTVTAGTGGTATGSGTYDVGASVPISASPAGAYVFTGWSGNGVTNPNTASTTVTLTGDETVSAAFYNGPTTPEQLGTIIFPNAVASGQPGVTPTTSTMPAVFVNSSNTPETVTALTTTGDFQPTVALPFTIAPGQSYSVTVTFAPSALGQRTGVLTAVSSDPTNPVAQFNLQGLGVNPSQPPSATITAPATAYTGSPLTVYSTAIAPMNNLTLHSIEWISTSGGWTVNVANVSGGTSNRTLGITFPSVGVWTLRAGVSVDDGATWYYSPTTQVNVSSGITNYTLQTMAIPNQSALPWYTPSPVVQQTYQVQRVNP